MRPAPGWRRLFRLPRGVGRSLERDVDEELAFHLAMREEKLRHLGETPQHARAQALARFGDPDRVRDECLIIDQQFAREVRMMEWLQSIVADARYGLRALRRSPAFTAVVVLTFALGVGATTGMFSLVDGILLRPLPYAEPQRLVQLMQSYPEKGLDTWTLSQQNLALYRDHVPDFAAVAGYAVRGASLTGDGPAERLVALQVTGDFFKVLGVQPVAGRVFGRDEDRPNGPSVVVLSYGFWQSHFAGNRRIIGGTLDLGGTPTRVLGVMPATFTFPNPSVQVYVPLGLDPSRRAGWFLTGIARLKPGASVEHAARQSTATMWTWARENPDLLSVASIKPEQTRMRALVEPLRTAMTGDVARPLLVLQAAVVVLLLIAIANIATLLSSRGASRTSEIAVRTALGASGARLARQLVTESLVLALMGGVIGVGLAALGLRAFTRMNAGSLPRLDEVSMNWRVLGFALAVTLVSGVVFGLVPGLRVARTRRLADDLAGTQKSSARTATRRLNNSLVVAQLALSVVLLISAGLVLKSFRRLVQIDLGFDPGGVTSISIALPMRNQNDMAAVASETEAIVDRVRAVPGVRGAAAAWYLPFSGGVNTDGYLVEGHKPPANAGSETQTLQIAVTPGFFDVMHIPFRYGRDFASTDRANTLPVVIVDEALARRYWTGGDAIGKRMRYTGDTTWYTIIGVVGSVRDEDVTTPGRPHTYQPYEQAPGSRPMLAVRSAGDPAPIITAIRRTIAELQPGAPMFRVDPLAERVADALQTRRLTELLLGGFALLAATLAAVGIYGIMGLYVANREREFGIRLAIGAQPASLVRLVVRGGFALAAWGVILGVAAALVATHWIQALLYEVSASDPGVFATLALALLGVALASCYVPARRAARADPLVTLRAE